MLNEFAGTRKVSWPRRNAASYEPRNLYSSQVTSFIIIIIIINIIISINFNFNENKTE